MAISRIYQNTALKVGTTIQLDKAASHHLLQVLRTRINEPVIIFNGQGGEYLGVFIGKEKNLAIIQINEFDNIKRESSLSIHLGQGIARGEKMDFIIQKAVELGVNKITPLLTEFSNVKLNQERWQKKIEHWQAVIISACEQSGRSIIPEIVAPQQVFDFLKQANAAVKLTLAPNGENTLKTLAVKINTVCLFIGPEGGLSENEIKLSQQYNFQALQLGPRILRTETAGLAAIAALQAHYGDFN